MSAIPAIASAGLPNSINIISGNPQTGTTGTILPDPLTVEYRDGAGSIIPGGSLIFTVTSGDAHLDKFGNTQLFVSTDGFGRAMVSGYLGNTPGPITVEVTDFGSTPAAVFNLTATAPNNSITVVSGEFQNADYGQPFADPIVVELRDGTGMLPDGVPVTFQIAQGSATFSNGQLSIVSNTSGGQAQASLVAGNQQGQVSIIIRASGYTDAQTSAFVNRPTGTPFVFINSGGFQQTTTNTPFPMPLVAKVDDGINPIVAKNGTSGPRNPVPDVPVTFTVQSGNALFSNGQSSIVVVTDSNGESAVFVDATSPEGQVVIDVTTPSAGNTRAELEIVGGSGTIITQGGEFQTIGPGDTTPTSLVAQVQDSTGTPVPGVTVTYRARATGLTPPTGITFTPSSDISDPMGNVTFVVNTTADTPNGRFEIEASAPGYSPAVFQLEVDDKYGSTSFDKLGGDNQTGLADQPLPSEFEVQAIDSSDGFIPIDNLVVTYTVTSGSASIEDAGGNPQQTVQVLTDANGIAGVVVTPINPGGPFTVTATANIFGTDYSEVFNGTGTPSGSPTITILSGDKQSGPPNTVAPNPLIAEYRDSAGVPVQGVQLFVEITSSNAQVRQHPSGTPSPGVFLFTDSNGQVSADILFGATPGAVTGQVSLPVVQGQDESVRGGFVEPAPFTANIDAPLPTITIDSGDGQTGAPNTTSAQPLAATLRDGNGNPSGDRILRFRITSGNALVQDVAGAATPGSSISLVTDSNGQARVNLLFGPTPGTVNGLIEDPSNEGLGGGAAQDVPFTATIVAGAPTLTITGGNNQTAAPGATLPDPLTVRLLNGAGAPIQGASVMYIIDSGDADWVGGTNDMFFTSTDANGDASATMVFGQTEGPVVARAVAQGQTVTFNETVAAGAVPPMISFDPPLGSNFILSPDGSTAFGSIAATPSGGSGTGPAATTTIDNCTYATNPSNFTVTGQPLTFVGNTTQTQSLSLTCQVGPNPVTARLTCFKTSGTAPPVSGFFDVTCPAAPASAMLEIVSGDGQSGPPNSTLPQPVVAQFTDSSGYPVGDATLEFSITSGNALVQSASGPPATSVFVVTDGAGQASVNVLLGSYVGQVVGEVCLPPQRGGFVACAPFTAEIVEPGSGTIQIVSGNNQSGLPGTNSEPLRVRLVSPQRGGQSIPVTFSLLSGSGALLDANGNPSSQVVVNTDPDGTASVVFRYGSTPGPVQIQAAADGFGSVVFDLTVLGASEGDTFRIVSGNNQAGAPGSRSQPLVVELLRAGDPGVGETINWFVRSGDGQVDDFATITGDDGRTTNFVTFGQSLGPIVVEARTGDGLQSVTFTLTTTPAAALAIRLVSGGGQSGSINSPFAEPLVFEVANGLGQVQPGVLVSFAVTQGSATLDANSATTDSAGRVSVTGRYGPNAGAIQVRASIGSPPNQSSAIADLTSVAPGLRIVSGDNQSAQVGTALPAPLVVEATRPAGTSGSLAGIVLRWTVIEGGGVITNATTTTDAAGRSSNALTLGAQPGANRVRVDTDGGGTVTFVATATAAPQPPSAVRLEIVSGNNQDIATNTDSAPLVVRVVDSTTGAPRGNVCVAFAPVTSGVTVSLAQVGSDANGLAQVTARLADVGPAVVSARVCDSGVGQVNFALNGAIENTLGLDPDDRAFEIAQAMDNACPALRALQSNGTTLNAGQADLLARCDELEFNAGANPDGVVDALEEILSDEAEAQNTAALTIAAAQFDNLKARIAALRSGTNGSSFGGLALQGGNGSAPLSFGSNSLNATEGQPAPDEAGIDFDRWGFFATGTIGDGDRDPDNGSAGFDFETRGVTAGVDYRYNDSLIFGAALGYASNDTAIGGDAGELESTGWSISGYSTFYKGDSWYADGVLTYGSNQYDITRNIEFALSTPTGTVTTIDQVNSASPDGSQFSAAFTGGRDFQRGAWGFGPYLRWQYTKVDFDAYTESVSNPNAPGLGLTVAVDEREVKSMQGVLGGKATYTMSTAWGVLIPHFQFEYVHEFKDDPDALTSRLVFDPTGTQIQVAGSDIDQSFMNLGLGMSALFANGRSAFMYYEKLLGQEGTSKDSIAIGIRIEF